MCVSQLKTFWGSTFDLNELGEGQVEGINFQCIEEKEKEEECVKTDQEQYFNVYQYYNINNTKQQQQPLNEIQSFAKYHRKKLQHTMPNTIHLPTVPDIIR